MNFKWNARLRKTAGACFNKRSVKITELLDCERVSRIELSSKVKCSYFSYFVLNIFNMVIIYRYYLTLLI